MNGTLGRRSLSVERAVDKRSEFNTSAFFHRSCSSAPSSPSARACFSAASSAAISTRSAAVKMLDAGVGVAASG